MVRDGKGGRVETRKNKREGELELEGEKAERDGTAVATVSSGCALLTCDRKATPSETIVEYGDPAHCSAAVGLRMLR